MTISEYLDNPTGENLQALGDARTSLILDYVARKLPGGSALERNLARASATAAVFTSVTRNYNEHVGGDAEFLLLQENVIDALLQPLCEDGLVNEFCSELLVQTGLLKPEDKKFVPAKDIAGPILALKYLVRRDYFPRISADIFIAFLTKPNPLLKSLQTTIIHQVLQVLHTL